MATTTPGGQRDEGGLGGVVGALTELAGTAGRAVADAARRRLTRQPSGLATVHALVPVAEQALRTVDSTRLPGEPVLTLRTGTDDVPVVGELLRTTADVDLLAYAALTLAALAADLTTEERAVRAVLDAPETARASLPELLAQLRRVTTPLEIVALGHESPAWFTLRRKGDQAGGAGARPRGRAAMLLIVAGMIAAGHPDTEPDYSGGLPQDVLECVEQGVERFGDSARNIGEYFVEHPQKVHIKIGPDGADVGFEPAPVAGPKG